MRRRAAGHEQALDLDVWATPFDVAGQPFTLLALADAAARSRCDWLAHSLLPRALALSLEIEALTAALATQSGETRERTLVLVAAAARRLGATLREESELAAAEAGSLIPLRRDAPAQGLLAALQSGMDGRTIAVDRRAEELLVHTDPDLLIRVLARLLANAVEATPAGGTVTIGCRRAGDFAEFSVRNTGPMPRAVQLRLFQRGFSTKGPGRGYGTYLARLITERFLGGEIAFRSESETVFTVRIPLAGGKEDGQ
jgi:signal transduction histidine kinase